MSRKKCREAGSGIRDTTSDIAARPIRQKNSTRRAELPRLEVPTPERCTAPEEPVYHLSTLANGLMVVTFPMPWLHEVGAMLFVRAGSRYEREDESGIAHFLEHMLFKGTASIPDPTMLHAHLEAMAADMNASTGQESNAYWITLPPEYLTAGFSAFCEIFTHPAFSGLEVERQVVLSEMREDENEQGEIINPAILSGAKLWPDHPLARPVVGNRESIRRITVSALNSYLHRYYHGSNMAVAFFGPLPPEEGLRLAQASLSSLPSGQAAYSPPPPPMPPGPHWVAVNDQSSQFSLSLFYRTEGCRGPLFHHLGALRRLLDDGFSSRLQATVREKQGLAYDIWASLSSTVDTGALEVGASVSPDRLVDIFVALLRELRGLQEAPPEPDEWQRVMTRWRATLTTTLDHPSELVERYVADRLSDTMEPLSETWSRIRAIHPDDLPEIARRIIRPDNQVVVLVGPDAQSALLKLQERFSRSY